MLYFTNKLIDFAVKKFLNIIAYIKIKDIYAIVFKSNDKSK